MLIKIDVITFNYIFDLDIISATVGTIVWLVNGHFIFSLGFTIVPGVKK